MNRILCFVIAILLSLHGAAFGTDKAKGNDAAGNPLRGSREAGKEMKKLRITANGRVMTATMLDNETARAFVAMLPLILPMNDLFGREKFGNLPKAVSQGGPREHTYRVGQIAYWSPKNDVAIFYHHDGQTIPEPGIIVIGEIDGGVESLNVPGKVTVSFELAQ